MNRGRVPVLALDGPGGSGKGEISRRVAGHLGWSMLDSGALYRVTAVAAWAAGVPLDDEAALSELAATLDIRFEGSTVLLAGKNITALVRAESTGTDASKLAALPGVRRALLDLQRSFRVPPGLVADGRDMGSVVFPDALCKVFLTASPEIRAERRHKQLKEQGISVSLASLFSDIADRDARDASREASPLKAAEDAIVIDTSNMTIEQVVAEVLYTVRSKLEPGAG